MKYFTRINFDKTLSLTALLLDIFALSGGKPLIAQFEDFLN